MSRKITAFSFYRSIFYWILKLSFDSWLLKLTEQDISWNRLIFAVDFFYVTCVCVTWQKSLEIICHKCSPTVKPRDTTAEMTQSCFYENSDGDAAVFEFQL